MKNTTKKRLGIVVVMLVLVLAIGATAGTTLARYITSATITSETATVAKWGYVITASSDGIFSDAYNNGAKANYADGTLDVKSSAQYSEVVAPGTGNSSQMITITGMAEVDAEITIDVTEFVAIALSNNEEMTDAYYPLKWAAGVNMGTGDTLEYADASSADDLAEMIATAFNVKAKRLGLGSATAEGSAVTFDIPALTNLTERPIVLTIGWEWALETLKDEGNYNAEDTLLGSISAGLKYSEIKANEEIFGKGKLIVNKAAYTDYCENSEITATIGLHVTIKQVQTTHTHPEA